VSHLVVSEQVEPFGHVCYELSVFPCVLSCVVFVLFD